MTAARRVLVYVENYIAGGTERFTFDLVNGLDKSRYDVTLWSNRNSDFGHGINRAGEGVHFREIGILTMAPLYAWLTRRRLPAILAFPIKLLFILLRYLCLIGNILIFTVALARARPDVLHVVNGGYPGGESCQAALIAARASAYRVPRTILTILSHPFERQVPLLEKLVDKWVGRVVDVIVFNSRAACETMIRRREFPPHRVTHIHSSTRFCQPQPAAIAANRARLGISGPIIGMVGALIPGKGQRFLVQALQIVRETVSDARLVLVGDGSDRANLETLAADLGVRDAVIFTGMYTDDMLALNTSFDVVAFSSLREGLPYAILEGMAAGRPIVATRVGGIPEQIEDGLSGLLVPPGDAVAMARGLVALLTDPERAAALGRAARARVEKEFSLERMIAAFQLLYEKLGRYELDG